MENQKIETKQFRVILFNSTVVYIFSYLFVFFMYQLAMALMAKEFNIRTMLTFYKLSFLTPDDSGRWYVDSALTIFSSAPLLCIIMAFVCIMLYRAAIQTTSLFKLFFLWTAIHSLNRLFASYAIGSVFFQYDSNLIADWLYYGPEIKIFFSAICVIILYIIGNYTTSAILSSADSFLLINKKNRNNFIRSQLLYPWLTGSLAVFLFFMPHFPLRENVLNISLGIMILPILLRHRKIMTPELDDDLPGNRISWRYLVFLLVFLIGFRLAFGKGILLGDETEKAAGILGLIIFVVLSCTFVLYQIIRSRKRRRREFEELVAESMRGVEM